MSSSIAGRHRELIAVGGRIAEVEGRLGVRLVAECLAKERDVRPFVLTHDPCELRELTFQRAACFPRGVHA